MGKFKEVEIAIQECVNKDYLDFNVLKSMWAHFLSTYSLPNDSIACVQKDLRGNSKVAFNLALDQVRDE